MRLLVLGAGSGTGRLLTERALAAGHRVTAVARRLGALAEHPALTRLEGSVLDAGLVERAVAGQDAVAWTVGIGGSRRAVTLFSAGGAVLLAAMAHAGVRRLVVVTGVGAGESRGHGGFVYDRFVFPLFTRGSYEDKDRLEALVRASGLDWTIVRPAVLTDGPARGRFRVIEELAGVTLRRVARADVAAFLLSTLEGGAHSRRTVHLSD